MGRQGRQKSNPMETQHPMDGPRCAATAKGSGARCKRRPIPGGSVCVKHGGAAPQVRRKAAERLADLIDPQRALREAASLAYSNVQEIFDEHGNLLPIKDWPAHLAAAIASVEVVKRNLSGADGEVDTVCKVKLWDKPRNLEMLFKHLGLLIDRVHVTGELEKVSARLIEARKRLAARKRGEQGHG
jgi:hypothetical protein